MPPETPARAFTKHRQSSKGAQQVTVPRGFHLSELYDWKNTIYMSFACLNIVSSIGRNKQTDNVILWHLVWTCSFICWKVIKLGHNNKAKIRVVVRLWRWLLEGKNIPGKLLSLRRQIFFSSEFLRLIIYALNSKISGLNISAYIIPRRFFTLKKQTNKQTHNRKLKAFLCYPKHFCYKTPGKDTISFCVIYHIFFSSNAKEEKGISQRMPIIKQ